MTRTLTALALLLASTASLAQSVPVPGSTPASAPVPGQAPATDKPVELGKRVTGMWDVSFQPFKDAKQIERMVPAEILRFAQDQKKWALVFDKAELPAPIPLRDTRTAAGVDQPGYLTAAVNLIRSTDQTADILRTDVLDTGDLRIGLIVAHVQIQGKHSLMQQALIEITPRLYYSIVMHAPAPDKDLDKSPDVVEAAKVFKAIVDSIEPVDLSAVRQDQDERLFRTRALFVNWTRKALLAALRPEQMLRFRRQNDDGKWEEIGYAYAVEEPANGLPRAGVAQAPVAPDTADGFRVGMRLRSMPEPGKTVDIESWMFVTFDRRHEVWSNVSILRNPASPIAKEREVWATEVGASDIEKQRVFGGGMRPGDFKEVDQMNRNRQGDDPEVVPFREVERYKLMVRSESRSAVAQPLERVLPPFYLPQALGTLLPRLLPLNNPTGYLFATYSSDTRQVMLRYVDVGIEQNVALNDKTFRAIPITERLGADGPKTIHYMSATGEYLGSVNEEQKLQIVPTTRQELVNLWRDADLSKPADVKE
jgi:hypothetical protein